ncbi:MAG: DUF4912 domain-containing protein [Campylobacterales bacterium]|nr:DUF4912 domain-containing protein [Campylobacterales bacterium]
MALREIMEKSLEEDHFSSHTHEVDLFAQRITAPGSGEHRVPERYDLDRCALLMVNPHRLFFYWEISGATKHTLGMEEESVMRLCVMRGEERVECAEVRGDVGSYYLAVHEPFSSLHAVLFWTGSDGITRTVLRSKKVTSHHGRYRHGEWWMDKNGTELLKASLPAEDVGSSGKMVSSIGLHVSKENR